MIDGLVGLASAALGADSVSSEAGQGSFWLPPARSTVAPMVDDLFHFIFYVSAFFFVLIVVLMVVFVARYRRKPGEAAEGTASHNTALEIIWTGIPLVIVVIIFWRGFVGYMELRTPPRNTYEVSVVGQKWKWMFRYNNGHIDENLHVPVDTPVRLTMTSEDVIHSLFIPAFRVKMDVVPGRYSSAWFRATESGDYDLYCAEYCGTGHSDMLAKVVVHKPGEFQKWLEDAANFLKRMPPADAGRLLYQRRGCAQCHSTDGRAGTGPTFKGIYGETHRFTDGSSAPVDENYIRQSILEPQAKIREGFQGVMPTYKGIVSDNEITAIIAYIQSLK